MSNSDKSIGGGTVVGLVFSILVVGTTGFMVGLWTGALDGKIAGVEEMHLKALKEGVGEFYFDDQLNKKFRFKKPETVYFQIVPDFSGDEKKLGAGRAGFGQECE